MFAKAGKALIKVVIDTNVMLPMLYSPKSIEVSSSRKIYDLLISEQIDAYSCDIFYGETLRIATSDPKLRKVKAEYFNSRVDELFNHINNVRMDDVNKHKISINWFPDIKYNVNENDIYLAVVAEFTKSKYIITQDQGFTDAYNDTFPNKNAYACSPRKFISLEKFFNYQQHI